MATLAVAERIAMKWLKWGTLGMLIVIAVYWSRNLNSDLALSKTADEINRVAPVAAGAGLRVDRAQFQGKKFDIYYSLTDSSLEAGAAADGSAFKSNVLKMVCSNAGLRRAVSRHVVVTSVLNGQRGNEVSRVSVSAADCPE